MVDLFAGRNTSDSAARLGYRVLLSVHRLAVYWIEYHSSHCLSFSEFVSRVVLISTGVAAFFPVCFQGREPYVAMGRARFLLGFIIFIFFNCVAMGRARFLLGFIVFTFFLTVPPWAEHGSCSAQGLFYFLFLVFVSPDPNSYSANVKSCNLSCLFA